jgi:hypothetical protein
LRYFVGAVAFGFAAVWILASLEAAIVCGLSAVIGYGAVAAVERMRVRRATRAVSPGLSTASRPALPSRAPEVDELPLWADALRSDLGHVFEPTATTSPLAREAEYGWPLTDDIAVSETLH